MIWSQLNWKQRTQRVDKVTTLSRNESEESTPNRAASNESPVSYSSQPPQTALAHATAQFEREKTQFQQQNEEYDEEYDPEENEYILELEERERRLEKIGREYNRIESEGKERMLARWKEEKDKQFHEAKQNLAVEYQQAKQTLDQKEMAVNATIE